METESQESYFTQSYKAKKYWTDSWNAQVWLQTHTLKPPLYAH